MLCPRSERNAVRFLRDNCGSFLWAAKNFGVSAAVMRFGAVLLRE
jgi:hypothetical protein